MGGVVSFVKDHWILFVEIIIIIIKYIYGRREEERVKVDNERKYRSNIEYCKRNNYSYICKKA